MPWEKGLEMIPSRSLTAIAPEKLPFHPIGKDRLPVPPFFQGRVVKLLGCIPFMLHVMGLFNYISPCSCSRFSPNVLGFAQGGWKTNACSPNGGLVI